MGGVIETEGVIGEVEKIGVTAAVSNGFSVRIIIYLALSKLYPLPAQTSM
jgi:hypothetical protein